MQNSMDKTGSLTSPDSLYWLYLGTSSVHEQKKKPIAVQAELMA